MTNYYTNSKNIVVYQDEDLYQKRVCEMGLT